MPQNPFQIAEAPVTPKALMTSEVTTGGTAVTVITGPCRGGFITNPVSAAAQGLESTENLYLDEVNTPGSTDATANGTTQLLQPGQSFTFPPLRTGVTVRVNATSAGHLFSGNVW
jgi:hypothetical protein